LADFAKKNTFVENVVDKIKNIFFDKKMKKKEKKLKIVNLDVFWNMLKYHVLAFYLNCAYLCCTNSVPKNQILSEIKKIGIFF